MSKTTARVLAVFAVLALAGCVREPFPASYYATPAPPPLQPYMGPPVYSAAAVPKRVVKRRHVEEAHPQGPLSVRAGPVGAQSLRLIAPSLERLPEYEAALVAGWSPDTERDVSREQLAALRRNRHAFLFDLTRQDGTILTVEGRKIPRLPSRSYWLDDGDFCGVATLQFVPGSDALPEVVHGHIGYAVVPWKRRRGYATRALALLLPVAREIGLSRAEITCDDDNTPSRRVIETNGGFLVGSRPAYGGKTKLVFHIPLADAS